MNLSRAARESHSNITNAFRVLPDFIIIGAMRCGTSSLFNNLMKHPSAAPPLKKEPHFFDVNYAKGALWYRRYFPSVFLRIARKLSNKKFLTGEATPYYIFHPDIPRRIAKIIPRVKLIALLRNPVDRAYSHYELERRAGLETLTFEEAIEKEQERIRGEGEKLLADEAYISEKHGVFSYCARGIYVDQLRNWTRYFPRDRILVLRSEDFFAEPAIVFSRVLDFLGLDHWEPKEFEKYKGPHMKDYKEYQGGSYVSMNPRTRDRLIEYFSPYNKNLYEFLGVNFHWEDGR
jgi:Sulfotransferase domain